MQKKLYGKFSILKDGEKLKEISMGPGHIMDFDESLLPFFNPDFALSKGATLNYPHIRVTSIDPSKAEFLIQKEDSKEPHPTLNKGKIVDTIKGYSVRFDEYSEVTDTARDSHTELTDR